jgi:hypothetical protein
MRLMKYLLRLWETEKSVKGHARGSEGRQGEQLNGTGSVWHGGHLGVWKEGQ